MSRECLRPLVQRAEFGAEEVRLLEVVAELLLDLRASCADRLFEPGAVAFVELSAELFRHRLVDGVVDKDVRESVAVVSGIVGVVGANQIAADRAQ